MAGLPRPLIHNITVEGGWDMNESHAVNYDINIDVTGIPGAKLPILRCDDSRVGLINVLNITCLDTNDNLVDVYSPTAPPPPPDNTPTVYFDGSFEDGGRPAMALKMRIGGERSAPASNDGETSPIRYSPKPKALYVKGRQLTQEPTRRRLFPPSAESHAQSANAPSSSSKAQFGPGTGSHHFDQGYDSFGSPGMLSPDTGILRESTNSLSTPDEKRNKSTSSQSTFLDMPAMEKDLEGFCHVPFPPTRESSAETIDIYLPSVQSSEHGSETTVVTSQQQTPDPRPFSPLIDTDVLRINKREGRAFGDDTDKNGIEVAIATPPNKQDELSRAAGFSPIKSRLGRIPARTSSRIPVLSPKKQTNSPKERNRPIWKSPGLENFTERLRSPVRIADVALISSRSLQSKSSLVTRINKAKEQSPPISPRKKSPQKTPVKKLESKSLDHIQVNAAGSHSPGEHFPFGEAAKTIGHMGGSRIYNRRGFDEKQTDSSNSTDLRMSIPTWLERGSGLRDTAVCVSDLGSQSTADFSVSGFSCSVNPDDSASNWNEPLSNMLLSMEGSPLPPSPTPSSQLMVPWTATKNLMIEGNYVDSVASAHRATVERQLHRLEQSLPTVGKESGTLSISFPSDYKTGACRISFVVTIYPGKKVSGGWYSLTIPGLPTQEADWGSIILYCSGEGEQPPVEFKQQGVIDPSIGQDTLSGFFDPSNILQIDVRFKEAVHSIENFQVNSNIQAQYLWEEGRGLWVCYTASCVLTDFESNFGADHCRFALIVCNGPAGVLVDTLQPGNRKVCFQKECLLEDNSPAEGMRIALVCPANDVKLPFIVCWRTYLGRPPISVIVPKICPDTEEPFEELPGSPKDWPPITSTQFSSEETDVEPEDTMTDNTWPMKMHSYIGRKHRSSSLSDLSPTFVDGTESADHVSGAISNPQIDSGAFQVHVLTRSKDPSYRSRKKIKRRRNTLMPATIARKNRLIIDAILSASQDKLTRISSTLANDDNPEAPFEGASEVIPIDSEQDVYPEDGDYIWAFGIILKAFILPFRMISVAFTMVLAVIIQLPRNLNFILHSESPRYGSSQRVRKYAYALLDFLAISLFFRALNLVADSVSVGVRNEWSGATNHLGRRAHVTKDILGSVVQKSHPIIEITKDGEGCVKTLVNGIVPDGVLWVEKTTEKQEAETMTGELQDKEHDTEPTSTLGVPKVTRDSAVLDYIDWALGWNGPFEE